MKSKPAFDQFLMGRSTDLFLQHSETWQQ